ncbi:hypothetical protein PAMA_008120 [Pampus argenteus]
MAGQGLEPASFPGDKMSSPRSLETECYMPSPERTVELEPHSPQAGVHLKATRGSSPSQTSWLLSSQSSILTPSSDAGFSSDWPSDSPIGSGWNNSYDDLQAREGETVGVAKIQEVIQRPQELESATHHDDSKTTTPWHQSTGRRRNNQQSTPYLLPCRHGSTGDLYDDVEGTESSEGSTSSPLVQQRPAVARRLSSKLRSRLCRSLGADLDQLLEEEVRGGGGGGGNDAARLNRLQLISSSISLHRNLSSSSLSSCSTPPRCHSLADLAERGEERGEKSSLPTAATSSSSGAPHEGPSRQNLNELMFVPVISRWFLWSPGNTSGW